MQSKLTFVEIFTDGACRGNPGPGGWGAILRYDKHEKHISGAKLLTTNNRMEMMAVIEALRQLKRSCRVNLYTDSKYVMKGMTEWVHRWIRCDWVNSEKRPVMNRDLWEEILNLSKLHQIEWNWVKGHHGHPENEHCDRLARNALMECKKVSRHQHSAK